ncbi:MAG: PEGA domain-containing protein [Ignavibacteriaceae bacterium]|nr:PEGA domain-containing protein [Ignavibacteriaceae bacterium]
MMKQLASVILFSLIVISCKTNPPTSPEDSTPQFGKAFIDANVSDAEIWLDNTNTGQVAPDTVETTVGTHTFTLKKADYLDASQIVEILKDSLISLNIALTEVTETGKLFVNSNAVGAQIFVDQINSGKVTPDTILATPGSHEIELQRAFYNSSSQQVEIIKDSLITLDIMLQEIPPSNVVLIEDFANVSCVPCVTSNRILESLTNVTYGHSKLVAIKFPTNFPSPNDPFYLANTVDCSSRRSYYNVISAPTTIIDGLLKPISTDSISVIAAIDQRLTKPLQFRMDVSSSVVGSEYLITVTVKVLNGAGIDFSNTVLHTVVTETDIEFATPPGSNGETKFYDVMRVMLPSNSGQSLNGISQTEEVAFQRQTTINSSWDVNNLHVVAFIQNTVTKEVFQSSSTFD